MAIWCQCTVSQFNTKPNTVLYSKDERVSGFSDKQEKDFILSAIIPIHISKGIQCTNEIFVETTDFTEAFLYSTDLINNDPNILPNITLGYDIRDSCFTESTALKETADLILHDYEVCTDENISSNTNPVSVVIGEYTSLVSIPMAAFLQLFDVPQISYTSTSAILNNRERYPYFYRTVPPDDQQTQAIVDLMMHYDWLYVSTIHSNDVYGEPAIEKFKELASANGICIDLDIGINDDFTDTQYNSVISKIRNSTARVILLFSSIQQVNKLFANIQQQDVKKFLWIASDAWVESSDILTKYNNIIEGMWGIVPISKTDSKFYEYLSNLTPSKNKRNPWFVEYHQYYYNCIYGLNCSEVALTSNPSYKNNSFTPFLIDAVYSFAHALNNFLQENCENH